MALLPEGRWIDVEGIYGGNFGTGDSASSAYAWNLNLRPLSEHFRAITFDKLGPAPSTAA
ncbi:MAG: hypothetical protein E6H57_22000 [Betaproteobacteria bacterium]|nr:MAG: hypothetical protein E6H57_22000 [Betaproteobacteria bacterium]